MERANGRRANGEVFLCWDGEWRKTTCGMELAEFFPSAEETEYFRVKTFARNLANASIWGNCFKLLFRHDRLKIPQNLFLVADCLAPNIARIDTERTVWHLSLFYKHREPTGKPSAMFIKPQMRLLWISTGYSNTNKTVNENSFLPSLQLLNTRHYGGELTSLYKLFLSCSVMLSTIYSSRTFLYSKSFSEVL